MYLQSITLINTCRKVPLQVIFLDDLVSFYGYSAMRHYLAGLINPTVNPNQNCQGRKRPLGLEATYNSQFYFQLTSMCSPLLNTCTLKAAKKRNGEVSAQCWLVLAVQNISLAVVGKKRIFFGSGETLLTNQGQRSRPSAPGTYQVQSESCVSCEACKLVRVKG